MSYYFTKKVSKHKSLDASLSFIKGQVSLGFSFCCRWTGDHAGIFIDMELLNLYVDLQFYDDRHDDDEA